MKVLHVLDHSLPHYDGYAFRSWEIIRFQRLRGLSTVQVTSAKHAGGSAASETVEGLDFQRTRPLGGLYRFPVIDQIGVVRGLTRRLRELIELHRPDVIHAHSPSLNGIAALSAGRRAGLPVVYEMRSFWEDAAVDAGTCREGDLRYRLTRASETWVVRRAAHVVPICRGIADDIAARGVPADRMTMVANSVDFTRFNTLPEFDTELAGHYGLTRGKTLGFAGSFFTFEGLDTLIDAMQKMRERDADIRLLLVGDGAERADLEARARALGVNDVVIFTGRVPHADIQRYYGIMDVLIYPRTPMRLTELVTPLKPLEAMAYGKNVVASDVGGHRELIDHDRTGMLFRAGDAGDLAGQTLALLDDSARQERLRRAARDHVEANHNWAVTVERYFPIYERVTGGQST